MQIIKQYSTLQLVKLDVEISGGFYAVRCTRQKKAKTGLTLDAANEVFNKVRALYISELY